MATIHLKYNTLKRVLDSWSRIGEVILVKKQPVSYISNILTFIPLDVCKIINTYFHEEIVFTTKNGHSDSYVVFKHNNYELCIRQGCYSRIEYFSAKSVRRLCQETHLLIYMMNEYMQKEYGKQMYIHGYANNSFSKMYDPEKDIISQTFYSKEKNLVAYCTYNLDNDDFTENNYLESLLIRNHKQFKHDIVMTKCLVHGLHKYARKIDE